MPFTFVLILSPWLCALENQKHDISVNEICSEAYTEPDQIEPCHNYIPRAQSALLSLTMRPPVFVVTQSRHSYKRNVVSDIADILVKIQEHDRCFYPDQYDITVQEFINFANYMERCPQSWVNQNGLQALVKLAAYKLYLIQKQQEIKKRLHVTPELPPIYYAFVQYKILRAINEKMRRSPVSEHLSLAQQCFKIVFIKYIIPNVSYENIKHCEAMRHIILSKFVPVLSTYSSSIQDTFCISSRLFYQFLPQYASCYKFTNTRLVSYILHITSSKRHRDLIIMSKIESKLIQANILMPILHGCSAMNVAYLLISANRHSDIPDIISTEIDRLKNLSNNEISIANKAILSKKQWLLLTHFHAKTQAILDTIQSV